MGKAKASFWVLGTVVVALVIGAGAWMLGISPMLDSAADMNEQAEFEAERVAQLEIQLAGLKADFEKLPEFEAELAELQVQIPTTIQQTELNRDLTGLALNAGVFLDAVNTGVPIQVATAPAAPAPTTTSDTTTEGTTDGTTGTTATPAPAGVQGFYAVPVELTVLGDYDKTTAFMAQLQSQSNRLIVVNGFVATGQKESGAQGGRPALAEGDLETVIQTWVYVLLDEEAAAASAADAAASTTAGSNT